MNTATRVVEAAPISLRATLAEKFWSIVIVAALLMSALSLVYAKDLSRRLFIEAQTIQQENIRTKEQWSKLILERSTLASQGRIHHLATRLHMEVPTKANTVRVIQVCNQQRDGA